MSSYSVIAPLTARRGGTLLEITTASPGLLHAVELGLQAA
jgi:hypothetical protein